MSVAGDSDEALARRAADGDPQAFSGLITRHQTSLFHLARRCTGDPEAAFDIVQESFAAAWLGLSRYDPKRPFAAWLRVITLNKCRDAARRRRARPSDTIRSASVSPADIADPSPSAEARLVDDERLRALDRAVAALPHALKEPLILTAFEGLSQREAAAELGVSVKAVETRVARARKILQDRLAAYYERK